MPPREENPDSIPQSNQKSKWIGNVQEITTPTLNDALNPLHDNVQKKIKEVEEMYWITLPKPWEYWKKEAFNLPAYANGHYLSISHIENIEIINDESIWETLRFYCDRVKTPVYSKKEKLSHHKDTRGLEEVIRWLKNWILTETTEEDFDLYAKQAADQATENH